MNIYYFYSRTYCRKVFGLLLILFSINRLIAQPVITSIAPRSGPAGTQVTITGQNFDLQPANNLVFFGSIRANVIAATASNLSVIVPPGAGSGLLNITTNGLTSFSNFPFYVTFSGAGASFDNTYFESPKNYNQYGICYYNRIADIDGDGKGDLVLSKFNGAVDIYKNNSVNKSITLGPKLSFPVGSSPFEVSVGDLDGDGKPDLVVCNSESNSISVLKNTSSVGNISFAPHIEYATGTQPNGNTIADIDGDGRPEIIVANRGSGTLSIFRNTGTTGVIAFAAKMDVAVGTSPFNVCAGDFDRNGLVDIACTNWLSNDISVLTNTSTVSAISFAPKVDYTSFGFPQNIKFGDLDSDGINELVVSYRAVKGISVYKNTSNPGNVSFAPKIDYPITGYANTVEITEMDGDGKPELVAVNSTDRTISILKNTSSSGNIAFASNVQYPTPESASLISIGDLDLDSKPDLFFSAVNEFFIYRNKIAEPVVSISGCVPNFGTTGTAITITGNNFSGATAVSFGGNPASSFTVVNDTTINAVIGVANSGFLVTVTTPNGTGTYINFVLWPLHQIISFNPTIAREGDQVVVYGSNLLGVSEVSFGGTAAKSFSVQDQNTLRALVGPGSSGSVSLRRYGATVSKPGFTFYGKPNISSFAPLTGTIGTTITITGTDFSEASSVNFGNVPASSFKVINSTTITAVVDTGATGNITVVTPGGTSSIGGFVFTTPPAPVISSFIPSSAPTGTVVLISGSNFLATKSVQFGGIEATEFNIISDNTITAKVSGGATGSIAVTTPGGSGQKSGFVFIAPPIISSFSPTSGSIGTTVSISGTNFNPTAQNNIVYFGAVRATVLSANSNTLTVKVPTGASFDPITVTTGGYTTNSLLSFLVKFPGAGASFTSTSFNKIPEIPAGVNAGKIAYGDLDGDGKIDLVVVNETTISVYRNTSSSGNISFAPKFDLPTNDQYINEAIIKDIDGDGKLDLIIGAGFLNQNISILPNTSILGTISFAARINIMTGFLVRGLAVGDLNEDGKPDLAVAFDDKIWIYRNTGTIGQAAFKKDAVVANGIYPKTISIADMNNDSKPDLAVVFSGNNINTPASFSVYKNVASAGGSFTPASFVSVINTTVGFNENTVGLTINDFDGDGKVDIAICNNASVSSGIPYTVSVFKNTGNVNVFSLGTRTNYIANDAPAELSSADMDGDGKIDIVVANFDIGIISVYKNNSVPGSINLAKKSDYPMTGQIIHLCITDLDNDGHLDIATPNYNNETLCILRNVVTDALVTASGSNPVSGVVQHKLTFDSTVQIYNGIPYVQRHYDITPANNPATATATVTLYFSQEEFDNFNAHPSHGLNLPSSPNDNQGKTNLRIYQYHGFSTTSLPGSYSGGGVEIDPDDDKIIWNAATQLWEITFNVSGFSGFFLGSAGKSMVTGLIVIDNTHFIKLNPNPATTQLWLHYNLESANAVNLEIVDIQGKRIWAKKQVLSGANIYVEDLPASIYFLRVYEPKRNKQYLLKFIKQ